MTIVNRFDILNPPQGLAAYDELDQAMILGAEATLALRPLGGGSSFALVVSGITVEADSLGIVLLSGKASLGVVNGRLWATSPAGQPVGRLNIITTGAPESWYPVS